MNSLTLNPNATLAIVPFKTQPEIIMPTHTTIITTNSFRDTTLRSIAFEMGDFRCVAHYAVGERVKIWVGDRLSSVFDGFAIVTSCEPVQYQAITDHGFRTSGAFEDVSTLEECWERNEYVWLIGIQPA